jgi:hypothetical protein
MDLMNCNLTASPNNSMVTIYKIIFDYLESKGTKVFSKNPHTLQSWGTCAFDSIMCYLEHTLPQDVFYLFHTHINRKARQQLTTLLPTAEKKHIFNTATLEILNQKASQSDKEVREEMRKNHESLIQEKEEILAQWDQLNL